MTNKIFTLFGTLIINITIIFAENVKIGDLYYNLNTSDKTAEITYQLQWSSKNYSGLTAVSIPAEVAYDGNNYRVTKIGASAFEYCSELISVKIPNGVRSIEGSAFANCAKLETVEIPESITNLGITSIAGCAFYKCYSLKTFINHAESPQIIKENVFYDVELSGCKLVVPKNAVELYKEADVWKEFGEIVEIEGYSPLSIHNICSQTSNIVRKVILSGQLFILSNGVMYNAQGAIVE